MTDVIAEPCTGVEDKACAGDCPVGCICEGERMLCIHPGERVNCGACEPVCPAGAIVCEDDVPGSGPSSPPQTPSSPASSARPAVPPRPARCPTTPTTSLATSPAGNATMSVRQVPGRGRVSGGPVPGCPAAPAAPAGSR